MFFPLFLFLAFSFSFSSSSFLASASRKRGHCTTAGSTSISTPLFSPCLLNFAIAIFSLTLLLLPTILYVLATYDLTVLSFKRDRERERKRKITLKIAATAVSFFLGLQRNVFNEVAAIFRHATHVLLYNDRMLQSCLSHSEIKRSIRSELK